MQPKSPGIVLLIGLSSAAAAGPRSPDEVIERRMRAMGTELTIRVEAARRADGLEASERAIRALLAAEARLSTWTANSETSRLNATPAGRPFPLSGPLARDLSDALACAADTRGAFTPGLGTLVEAWGLRSGGRMPSEATIAAALPGTRAENLLVADGAATRVDARFEIEEGAFGKGVGLDDAISALAGSQASSAVIDLGGQISVWGATSVTVGVADPRDRDRVALRLDVASGSVATTGNSERGIVVDGVRLGHVLDPKSGRPSPDFGSVTVWAERGVRADCLSTALYVMGPEGALDWAARHPEIGVVVLERDERGLIARATANLRPRLQAVADEIELRFLG